MCVCVCVLAASISSLCLCFFIENCFICTRVCVCVCVCVCLCVCVFTAPLSTLFLCFPMYVLLDMHVCAHCTDLYFALVQERIPGKAVVSLLHHPQIVQGGWLPRVTSAWQSGRVSNFDYLLYINLAAGVLRKDVLYFEGCVKGALTKDVVIWPCVQL